MIDLWWGSHVIRYPTMIQAWPAGRDPLAGLATPRGRPAGAVAENENAERTWSAWHQHIGRWWYLTMATCGNSLKYASTSDVSMEAVAFYISSCLKFQLNWLNIQGFWRKSHLAGQREVERHLRNRSLRACAWASTLGVDHLSDLSASI